MTATPAFTGDSTGGVIQYLLPQLEQETVQKVNFLIRKMAHIAAFGILALFVWQALNPHKYTYQFAWLFATLYGALDEWHQSFIPTRSGKLSDVLIDSLGAVIALLLLYLTRNRIRKRRK